MRRLNPRRAVAGLTLVELMVGIAVMAVLVATAAPFMGDMVQNSRLRESGNLLLSEALVAQSEAIKRNSTVRVSTNAGTVQVLEVPAAGDPVLLRSRTLANGVTAATASFDFGPEGRPAPFGTAVAINLSMTGATCSSDIRCPGLRVDAGGAIRLCGNQLTCS
jgi:type IV fimbrial biogenesis protein FimT